VRVLVIANPRATATSPRQRDVLAHALGSRAELEMVETANRGHAAALACRAMRGDVDLVVALGGDGTVNEVVNGLLTDGPHDGIPLLGVVPAGSTNVFARALGLPNDPIEATGALLDGVRAGRHRSISLGRMDDRWFIFAAGVGFDAAVVAAVERERRRGHRSTNLLYARVGLREFFAADRRHPLLHVELPDGTIVEHLHHVIITNTDPWTYVGRHPLRPTPEASFDTGLDAYVRTRMGVPSVLNGLAHMWTASPRDGHFGAKVFHDLSELVIRADEPIPVQVDGDLLEARTEMRFSSTPAALGVVV
jgi:diacylglycerol kinase family enzyme